MKQLFCLYSQNSDSEFLWDQFPHDLTGVTYQSCNVKQVKPPQCQIYVFFSTEVYDLCMSDIKGLGSMIRFLSDGSVNSANHSEIRVRFTIWPVEGFVMYKPFHNTVLWVCCQVY